MQRRQFLSILTGAGLGSPLIGSTQQDSPARTSGEVEDMARKLAEAQEEKIKLLTLLHEMRAPLNIMVLYADLILDNAYGELPDGMRLAVHRVKQGGCGVADLINAGFEIELSKRRRRDVAA